MENNKLKLALAFVIGIIVTLVGINFLSNTFNPFLSNSYCPRVGAMMGGMMGGYGGYGPGFGMFFGFLFNVVIIGAIIFVVYYLINRDKDQGDKVKERKRR